MLPRSLPELTTECGAAEMTVVAEEIVLDTEVVVVIGAVAASIGAMTSSTGAITIGAITADIGAVVDTVVEGDLWLLLQRITHPSSVQTYRALKIFHAGQILHRCRFEHCYVLMSITYV